MLNSARLIAFGYQRVQSPLYLNFSPSWNQTLGSSSSQQTLICLSFTLFQASEQASNPFVMLTNPLSCNPQGASHAWYAWWVYSIPPLPSAQQTILPQHNTGWPNRIWTLGFNQDWVIALSQPGVRTYELTITVVKSPSCLWWGCLTFILIWPP